MQYAKRILRKIRILVTTTSTIAGPQYISSLEQGRSCKKLVPASRKLVLKKRAAVVVAALLNVFSTHVQSSSLWEEPHPGEILHADLFAPVIEIQQRGDICRFLQFRSN